MYTYPYQILKKRLTTQVTQLKLVDWFLDQYNKKDKAVMLHTEPAAFIEVRPITTEQLSYGHQMAETEIVVHLVTTSMFDNDKRVKKGNARDHAQLVDDIYKALSGFSAKLSYLDEFAALKDTANDRTIFNSMMRDGIPVTPHAIRGLQITLQLFTTLVFDHAAVKTLAPAAPSLIINPEE